MTTEELQQKLDAQEKMLTGIYISVEKTRKYFLWTMIITVVTILLPIIGLIFMLPMLISTFSELGALYSSF